jgi:hypothetical protein
MRYLAPEMFMDEWFGCLDPVQRLLWIGLLTTCADDQGRLLNNPTLIRVKIFPYDTSVTNEQITASLRIFQAAHKLHTYTFGLNGASKECVQIVNWWKYQNHAAWAGRSPLQAPQGWRDRIRAHEKGQGENIVQINWDTPGGFTQEDTKPLPSDCLPPALPLPSRESESESESESEVKSESESEDESSVSPQEQTAQTTDDDQSLTVSKSDLLRFIGIPKKYQAGLERDAQIKPQDLLAELARNFARQGTGKGKVGQPGWITALNLSRHEYPSAEWYDRSAWIRHLPDGITQKLGLVTQSQEEEIEQCPDVATRNTDSDPVAARDWDWVLEQLKQDVNRGTYEHWIEPAHAIKYDGYRLQIGVPNSTSVAWLTDRMTSTINRLLVGFTNNPHKTVEFVSLEAS